MNKYDVMIIGGGALGTFHAYHALQMGLTVLLLEKDKMPQSATTRNFGQVVPSGMDSKWQNYGRISLDIYNKIQQQFDISVRNNGTVYLASNEEEQTLIEELHQINKNNNYPSALLTKEQCLEKYSGLKKDYVTAGLFFAQEVTVEPRTMIHKVLQYLVEQKGLQYYNYNCAINCEAANDEVTVTTASNKEFKASKLIICNGSEFKTLYPDVFAQSELVVTKLQMLQTVPQKNYTLPGSILTGLTIRRYESFYECASFQKIKEKEDANSLEKKWGVHILFKQAADGSIILGDSHEYADAKDMDELGYDMNTDINYFMISEAKKIIDLPSYDIQHQWYGIYSQCKERDIFEETIDGNIHIITGIGGKGMTGSAGYAQQSISNIFNK